MGQPTPSSGGGKENAGGGDEEEEEEASSAPPIDVSDVKKFVMTTIPKAQTVRPSPLPAVADSHSTPRATVQRYTN